jgi:hypothetical protein
MTNY